MLKLEQEKIQISNLSQCDHWLPTVTLWHHQEWLKASSLPQDHPDNETKFQERKCALQAHLGSHRLPVTFVAHNNEEPIGTVSLVYYNVRDDQAPSEWLSNLYVLPKYRQQGIASELLNVVVAHAQSLGLQRLFLYTRDQTDFYMKRNWRFLTYGTVQKQRVSVLDYLLTTQ
ncbi:hypothetical protein TDB9533_01769 [Thalassocella blandensis]|nr:hypothetical protein TDB9533_01769 [Thalassocella blandensis]